MLCITTEPYTVIDPVSFRKRTMYHHEVRFGGYCIDYINWSYPVPPDRWYSDFTSIMERRIQNWKARHARKHARRHREDPNQVA